MAFDVEESEVGAGMGIGARIWRPPAGTVSRGALVDLHGGMWSKGDRSTDAALDARLAARGIVVVALDVPAAGAGTAGQIVSALMDATSWARGVAAQLADGERVGLLGCSSGGHLALLVALAPSTGPGTAFDFVVGCWPVVDPASRRTFAIQEGRVDIVTATDRFFGSREVPEGLNPQALLDRGEHARLPPLLLAVAGQDKNVPDRLQVTFEETYRARGGSVQLRRYPSATHSFGVDLPDSRDAGRLVDDIERFVVSGR